jgi:hypothetical protein
VRGGGGDGVGGWSVGMESEARDRLHAACLEWRRRTGEEGRGGKLREGEERGVVTREEGLDSIEEGVT